MKSKSKDYSEVIEKRIELIDTALQNVIASMVKLENGRSTVSAKANEILAIASAQAKINEMFYSYDNFRRKNKAQSRVDEWSL